MLAELGAEGGTCLTPDEAAVLRELSFHTPATPRDTVLFTDPNKDPDDVVAYTIGKQLQVTGFVRLTDVAVTLGDASVREQRARLAKGVFNRLQLPDVRVSRGQDYPMSAKQAKDHAKFLQEGQGLRAESAEICDNSLQALQERLMQAPQGLSMVVIAGMTDAHALVDAHPALVRERVKSITIMGASSRPGTPTAMCSPTHAPTTMRQTWTRPVACTARHSNCRSRCASLPRKLPTRQRCRPRSTKAWRRVGIRWAGISKTCRKTP